jgi:hypothetical protein
MIVHVRFILSVLLCGLPNAAAFEQGLIAPGDFLGMVVE